MKIGEKAPDFTLMGIDENGDEKEYKLSDFAGKNLILYFYPKDETPGCTIEANDFNDNLSHLVQTVQVVGVSRDDLDSHKHFQERYDLKFALLSDPDSVAHELYGAVDDSNPENPKSIRSTFLIDKDGLIKQIWNKVDVHGHVEEVMKALKEV